MKLMFVILIFFEKYVKLTLLKTTTVLYLQKFRINDNNITTTGFWYNAYGSYLVFFLLLISIVHS